MVTLNQKTTPSYPDLQFHLDRVAEIEKKIAFKKASIQIYQSDLAISKAYLKKASKPPQPPSVLHLTLKKKWFLMILRGEKKEEYREIKPHWEKRLSEWCEIDGEFLYHKDFDYVLFSNGYGPDVPKMLVECKTVRIGYGADQWGGIGDEKYYVIELGKVVETKNLKQRSILVK